MLRQPPRQCIYLHQVEFRHNDHCNSLEEAKIHDYIPIDMEERHDCNIHLMGALSPTSLVLD